MSVEPYDPGKYGSLPSSAEDDWELASPAWEDSGGGVAFAIFLLAPLFVILGIAIAIYVWPGDTAGGIKDPWGHTRTVYVGCDPQGNCGRFP